MRILMINHEFTITGASTVFLRLAAHLRAQGHSLALFPVNPADGPMQRRFAELGIPIQPSAVVAAFDLVIANTVCAASWVIRIGAQAKTIWFLHEAEIGLNILLKNPELAEAFRHAAAIVYQTAYQQEVYRSFTYRLEPSKFHLVANGTDIVPGNIAGADIPPKSKPLRLVQVGSIEPRKRPGDVIRAAALSGLAIETVLCGKFFMLDEDAQEIIARAPENFRFPGETPPEETLGWIASADIFCLASGSESQPVSVFEAAQLAKPLLLSDLPGYRDIFAHGRNCLMFPPGYVELFARSLQIYAASPQLRADMAAAARQTGQRYTNAAFCARFDRVIDTVMAPA
jgi:glycosyltransferase involved in cell wall biosynthesis